MTYRSLSTRSICQSKHDAIHLDDDAGRGCASKDYNLPYARSGDIGAGKRPRAQSVPLDVTVRDAAVPVRNGTHGVNHPATTTIEV